MDEDSKGNGFSKKVNDSFKDGTKPKFLGGNTEGGDAPSGLKSKKTADAAEELKANEDSAASSSLAQSEDSLSGARETEEEAEGFYSGGGKVSNDEKQKGGIKGFLSRKAPMLLIFVGLMGLGGAMTSTQLFQPFSMVAQFSESFNSMHKSANLRSAQFFRMQMNKGRVKNPIKGKIFGADTFKITDTQAAKLAAQGIDYDDDYKYDGDTKSARVLKFTDQEGNVKIVTADESVAKAIGDNAVDFKTLYANDVDFFNKYNAGSMTWRGAIANWFGTLADKFFKNNNLTRNAFDDFRQVVAENNGNSKAAVQEILSARTDEVGGGGFKSDNNVEKAEGEDSEGNPKYGDSDARDIKPGETAEYRNGNNEVRETYGQTSRKSLNVNEKLNDIAGSVQKSANIVCTVSNVIGSITLLVTAAEALQIINLTTAYFETVDKVKAGYGDDSPIHDLTNALNEKQVNKNAVLALKNEGNIEANGNSENITNDGIKALEVVPDTNATEKSAMESSGITSLYNGEPVNPNDPSVQSFNFSNNIKRILGGIGVSMAGFSTCAIAKIGANMVSGATDAASIIACIAGVAAAALTAGTSAAACAGLAAKIVANVAFGVAIGVTIAAVIATITPIVSHALTRDLVSNLGGEDLGNALTSGGNMYLGNMHRANGGSLGTDKVYATYKVEEERIIAENAKYERSTLSPFDLTSKYTFMGTLLTKMMSFFTTSTLTGFIKTGGSTISSSIVGMLPTASAYNVAQTIPDMEQYQETCPYLASINAVGDAYCNPYSMTDLSTMEKDPLEIIDYLNDPNNFPGGSVNFLESDSSDGNVRINGKSDLAKYILYCDNRESAFGIADQNIVSAVSSWGSVNTESTTFNTVANSAIGAVPVLGDVIDVVQNDEALNNIGYVGGESCVAGNNVEASESPNWNQAKYYQRFIEDQSLAESMGLIKKSAVTAFLDDYYEQNPLDNSYEGILARKSGLDKDTVVAILDLVEYGNYIANYNPAERYAFGAPAVKAENELKFDNEYQLSSVPILLNQIVYADVRNRNYVV